MNGSIPISQLGGEALPQRLPSPSMTVELTNEEDQLCTLLDNFAKDGFPDQDDRIECRIAGGWVRDKLLGIQSNDIDIALSSMTGVSFAEMFIPYVKAKGFEVGNVHKIAINPEQSKHLETAKTTLLGLEIDFVNLRSEEYAVDSRIPTKIDFGTPLQDAMRRDLTINALFYNVHTRSVEDQTGSGLDDLKNGIARTPLAPRETFMDDPLRVLRCIRFASRFGFNLEDNVQQAAKLEEVREAIIHKISRERVGDEVDKMLKGRDPLMALQLIDSLGLHEAIFHIPSSARLSGTPGDRRISFVAATLLTYFLYGRPVSELTPLHPKIVENAVKGSGARQRLYLASALASFEGISCHEKRKDIPASEVVIREGLKLGTRNHYMDGVPLLLQGARFLSKPAPARYTTPSQRVSIGLALRDKNVSNQLTDAHWTTTLLLGLVLDLVKAVDLEQNVLSVKTACEILQMYNDFTEMVETLELESSIYEQPRLNGNEISGLLGLKPGPWMSRVISDIVSWQLDHPLGSKEECQVWLRQEVEEGRIVIEDHGKRSNEPKGGTRKKVRS
ncbi:CCA tRNA nucleotidyltransferase, mitochondrial [Tulasnella sp. 418]|nr:CCA tRNA nucleotidyltransferase, mitochondrial [Tulasnella sp. 418]